MIEIKKILAKFFADKLSMLVSQAVDKKGFTEQDIDNLLNDENQYVKKLY